MGCGKTREVIGVTLIDSNPEPLQENDLNVINETLHNNEESSHTPDEVSPDRVEKKQFTRVETIRIPNNEEVGKKGEDFEAGVINKGRAKEKSIDFSFRKIPAPKKLPPINNPPLPLGIPSTLSKFNKHRPDMDMVNDLLNREQNKGFEDLQKESFKVHEEDSIREIMKDLSID